MIQQIEYEWKPPYCTIFNKVGHECKQKENKPRKKNERKQTWEPKEKGVVIVNEPKSKEHNKETTQENVETVEDPWIKARTANRSRGKGQNPEDIVDCNNGFEALVYGECSTNFDNKVP